MHPALVSFPFKKGIKKQWKARIKTRTTFNIQVFDLPLKRNCSIRDNRIRDIIETSVNQAEPSMPYPLLG